ncbi:hypothetical protein LBW94_038245, partial [Nocardia sp. alder85J]|nr:hypothetical protein [Nocardia sp. alder85J]
SDLAAALSVYDIDPHRARPMAFGVIGLVDGDEHRVQIAFQDRPIRAARRDFCSERLRQNRFRRRRIRGRDRRDTGFRVRIRRGRNRLGDRPFR